jgi:multidrug efflux pump subunit AcrA (membrane-fusion protein)
LFCFFLIVLQRLQQERSALKKRKDSAEQAVETAKINLDRQKLLFEKGLSARRAYELAKLELNRYEVDDANAAAELARIDVRLSRQLTQSVRATAEGQIHRTISGQGNQIVKAGQVIATIVPISESRAVELWVSGNDIPLITLGKKVRLQFEGWPSIQFSGWPSVAIGTFGGVVAVTDLVDSGEGKFRIVVKPDDESWPHPSFLRQGIQARGWVLLSQVTLIYELWRRFNGFPMIAPPDTYKTYREIAKEKKGL